MSGCWVLQLDVKEQSNTTAFCHLVISVSSSSGPLLHDDCITILGNQFGHSSLHCLLFWIHFSLQTPRPPPFAVSKKRGNRQACACSGSSWSASPERASAFPLRFGKALGPALISTSCTDSHQNHVGCGLANCGGSQCSPPPFLIGSIHSRLYLG